MSICESGVLAGSSMDYLAPTSFAKETLYYVTQYGHFLCDDQYLVRRASEESFLFFYLIVGTLKFQSRGKRVEANAGQMVLLDCGYPHEYRCESSAEFCWFHFNGVNARSYAAHLYEKYHGIVMTPNKAEKVWKQIDEMFLYLGAQNVNEHIVSLHIAEILSRLAREVTVDAHRDVFSDVLEYIRGHYGDEITVGQLAERCGFSVSYFVQSFKRRFGSTPHEYLQAFRLRQAKRMLEGTRESIESIALRCGFHSASHFARAFRADADQTPTEFRALYTQGGIIK